MSGGSSSEKRIHARVEILLESRILTEEETATGYVRDLSHGGALLMARTGLVQKGATVGLEIKLPDGGPEVSVLAEVVRVIPGTMDWARYGLRFVMVEPAQRKELRDFVEMVLSHKGAGSRQHPRVYRRVDVVCRSPEQFRAVMENISQGGLAIQCQVALSVNEEVTVEIWPTRTSDPLQLTGNVVHTRTVVEGTFHVGLKFKPLPPETRAALKRLIERFLEGDDATS